jgi:ankyrin repeat protein
MIAAQNGYVDVVRILIDTDPKIINQKNDTGIYVIIIRSYNFLGFTALMLAAQNGRFGVVSCLIEREETKLHLSTPKGK